MSGRVDTMALPGRRTSEELVQTVRDRSDIVSVVSGYLALKKAGQNHVGLCPFHAEKTPSFSVSPSKQIFHCFGCGEGGDVFHFLMKIEGLSFPQALRALAERAGVPVPAASAGIRGGADSDAERDLLLRINEAAAEYFSRNLKQAPEAQGAREYLKARGIRPDTVETFRIGYALPDWDGLIRGLGEQFSVRLLAKAGLIAEGDRSGYYDRFRARLIFPIKSIRGELIGFGGRILQGEQPKYLNSPETPLFSKGRHLFALDRARGSREKTIILVEGYFDVIVAHQEGFQNVAGTMGTALTAEHLRTLKRFCEKSAVIFDPDPAGRRAAVRAAGLFAEAGLSADAVSLPEGEDPDLFLRKRGADAFRAALQQAVPLMEFSIKELVAGTEAGPIEEKIRVLAEVFPLIERLQSNMEKSHYLRRTADFLNVPEDALRAEFHRLKRNLRPGAAPAATVPAAPRAPKEEVLLVHLLLERPERLGRMNGLEPGDFADPRIRRIVEHLIDPKTPAPAPQEEGYALYTELLVREGGYDDPEATFSDCVRALRGRRARQSLKHLGEEIRRAERAGDWDQVKSLQKRMHSIRQEISS